MSGRRDLREGARVLVLGGTSDIALALVRALQEHAPREVALVGRDGARLERVAESLRGEGVERVITCELDALDLDSHAERLRAVDAKLGGTDIALLAVGVLGSRTGGVEEEVEVLRTNVVVAGSLLLHVGELMRARGAGTIVVLSSVAAERPRPANAVYGASKAGLDALARGLADRLWRDGVRVLVVRPGFVFTSMTAGLKPAPMAVTASTVADSTMAALRGARPVTRAPGRLRWPMLVVRLLPRALMRRMKL
jgi:decaprenylphospho-beta-D-erythro-pentofuranosid-2-ulose 2-reductase